MNHTPQEEVSAFMPQALRQLSCGLAPVGLALVLLSSPAGCAAGQLGASDENLSSARSAFSDGAKLFSQNCAGCHGGRGEGTERGPAVIGIGALPVYPSDHNKATNAAFSDPRTLEEEARARPAGTPSRPTFKTAAAVQRYVSTSMPLPKAKVGTLSDQEYWAIISFMLKAHGAQIPKNGLNPNNAQSIELD
jgi:mono/diheme cytochrome c family protein